MQLIPATQQRFGVKDAFDAESNVRGGMAYLKWLKLRFNGDWGLVAAAYNAGEGAVDRYRGIPPYRETQDYVRRVLFFAGLARQSRI
jgi:soluble lytic murein transglycosylase-like protein